MNLKVISSMLAISALTGCATQGRVQVMPAQAIQAPVVAPVYTAPVYTAPVVAPVYVNPWCFPYGFWGHHHHHHYRGRW